MSPVRWRRVLQVAMPSSANVVDARLRDQTRWWGGGGSKTSGSMTWYQMYAQKSGYPLDPVIQGGFGRMGREPVSTARCSIKQLV